MPRSTLVAAVVAAPLVAAGVALMSGLTSGRDAALAGAAESERARAVDPWTPATAPKRSVMLYDRFETLTMADGLPSDRTTCVLADGDLLAVGTDEGLALRWGGAWSVLTEKDGLGGRYVTSLSRDVATGDLWIGTLRGLSRLSAGALRTYRQTDSGLMNDVVYQVVCEGPLTWVATAAGLSVLDARTGGWSLHDVKNSVMHEPWCYAVAVGPQRTWVGVWGGGVVELDRAAGLWREYRDPDGEMEIDLLRDDGPIHDVTSSIAFDEGVLWQSTYFGLSRYDGSRWRSFNAADAGLPGDFISHVASRGATAWIASDQGLGVFDGATCISYRRQADGTCAVRTCTDGREVDRRTLATAPGDDYLLWTQPGESDVWIATGHGLSHGIAARGDRKDE
jgi:ligand-binding sensor domain-containing protein